MNKKLLVSLIAAGTVAGLGLSGCGGSSSDSQTAAETDSKAELLASLEVPDTYSFASRFVSGAESAQYPGQVARQVLISDLNTEIASKLEQRITGGEWNSSTSKDTVLAVLNSYFDEGTNAIGDNEILLTTTPPTLQSTYNDISTGKNLVGKFAGNDAVTDHKDWDGGDFKGWNATSPEALIRNWFDQIAENTVAQAEGTQRAYAGTGETLKVYHTQDGLDLKQMVQKFLLGAITFSQATDDYLDDATDGKGLLTDNTQADGDGSKPYTKLEHQFDEGFGYFGAARNYLAYTDGEIAGKSGRDGWSDGYHDTDGDGQIDLNGEFNFGNSTNAAKRDLGSTTGTDFTRQAMDAFLTGRTIIAQAGDDGDGELTSLEMEALQEQRDIAVSAWEKALAATVVHYINDTLSDMDKAEANDGYSYVDHTKHWAEMKAFALGLQFNPRSPLNEGTRFTDFHDLVGERPALPGDEGFAAYRDALLAARGLMQEAYDFSPEDVENW
ncbi:protein of unknown function [Marinobacter daqiaonensis]|uniref:DUF4856 domain-containing protein n=1 Tax=Marinobacter daqiaonensis TaxID=650891 RepID=A0A1I6IF32_9GAMM|nr:DUF4856 domain-containing protein [Marinobacter daqiaonensis]SFR65281.1 protein of unknown function [Marinobacter daqiaonensis]